MASVEPVTSGTQLRAAFGCFPSGIAAVCAMVDGQPVGMAASSFTSVSLDPPLVSVCIQHTSTTWPVLRNRPGLGLSVLAEGQDEISTRLAKRDVDRFAGTDWAETVTGGVLVHGATLWLDCTLHAEVPSGDHCIVLLQVHALRADPATPPLVFHGSRYRKLAAS